jgi:hypothetical protein
MTRKLRCINNSFLMSQTNVLPLRQDSLIKADITRNIKSDVKHDLSYSTTTQKGDKLCELGRMVHSTGSY